MIKMSSLSIDKGPAVLITLWSLTSASLLFVLARLLVRLRILQKAGWDDILITFSIILAYIYDAILTIAVKSGFGRQQSTLTPSQVSNSIKFIMAGFAPGLLSIVVPKLAVVALLVRTMNPSPRQKWFLWGTVLGSEMLLMGCVIVLYLQCRPASEIWEMDVTEGSCWSMTVLVDYSIVAGGIAATVDAYLAIYPAVIIWNLHMGIKKKLGLSFALGLGACACVMAVVKCTRIPTLYNMTSITYATADLFIWTSIESNTIIIAASVPTIAPLIEITLGKRILSTTERDSNRTESNRHLARPQQVHIHPNQKRARAWLSAINIEQSYHECSIQRGSSAGRSLEDLEGLTPTEGVFGGENGSGSGIQRRDDVIIEYGRWPEGIWGRDRGVYMEKV